MGRGVDHPPLSSAEVKARAELYLYSPLGLRGLFYGEFYLYLCDAKEKGTFYLYVFIYFACVLFGETVIGICIPCKNMSFVFC
jgi:hypothetical protein